MSPYDVLGVAPDTPLPEVEATYRLRVRAHHPDLHQADGPEALEAAEQTTRHLNDAMAAIRAEHKGQPVRSGGRSADRSAGWPAAAGGAHEPVPCPYCSAPFERLDHFWQHLAAAHHREVRRVVRRRPRNPRPIEALGKLRFVPSWLGFFLVVVSFKLGIYALLTSMCFVLVVLWAQTSKRFKRAPLRAKP